MKCFYNVVLTVLRQNVVPQGWEHAAIKVLFEEKNLPEGGNHSGISLAAHTGKVVLKVAAIRLSANCEKKIIPREA